MCCLCSCWCVGVGAYCVFFCVFRLLCSDFRWYCCGMYVIPHYSHPTFLISHFLSSHFSHIPFSLIPLFSYPIFSHPTFLISHFLSSHFSSIPLFSYPTFLSSHISSIPLFFHPLPSHPLRLLEGVSEAGAAVPHQGALRAFSRVRGPCQCQVPVCNPCLCERFKPINELIIYFN